MISVTLYGADDFGKVPCLIYVHGFKGFKDWAFVPYCGTFFEKQGFSFLAFNFSHNGISGHSEEFTELNKFRDNTFSLELEETREVIYACSHLGVFGKALHTPIGLIGHSRGGGIAILTGAANKDVGAVASWAGVSTFDRYEKSLKQQWRKDGFIPVKNQRTGQVFELGKALLEDVERHGRSKLNILDAVKNMDKPLLIAHGQEDETVPAYEAEQLNIFGQPGLTTFRLIPRAGHTFGSTHPFNGASPELDELLNVTADFFHRHLKN